MISRFGALPFLAISLYTACTSLEPARRPWNDSAYVPSLRQHQVPPAQSYNAHREGPCPSHPGAVRPSALGDYVRSPGCRHSPPSRWGDELELPYAVQSSASWAWLYTHARTLHASGAHPATQEWIAS